MILKYLIIGILIFYVLYKMGVFRSFVSGYNEPTNRRPPNGNVKVDNASPKEKKRQTFKGGDYVDYEEIK